MDTETLTVGDSAPDQGESFPKIVGRYQPLSRLGAGGMGIVLSAHDPELDRTVAIKLLRPKLRKRADTEAATARLLREARAMATLAHDNVLPIYDVGTYEGGVYLAMELVEGGSLEEWLRRHPDAGWRDTANLFLGAGRGLAAAHRAGLVHRDFKPDNVLVGRDGRVRVMDFGLAKLGHRAESEDVPTVDAESGPRLDVGSGLAAQITDEGVIVGTLAFIAPEQLRRETTDHRSDQFSFCAALFRGLFGHVPYALTSPSDHAAFGHAPRLPPDHNVPSWLVAVVLRGLEVDPRKRFDDMDQLLARLNDGLRPRRRWPAMVGLLTLAGAAASVVVFAGEVEASLCDDPARRLEEVWNDDVTSELDERFEAAATPSATRAGTKRALDEHASEWIASYQHSCERPPASGLEFDRRVACLEESMTSLKAVVDVLGSAGPAGLLRARSAAGELPDSERCLDDEALARRLPPPTDPVVAAQVQLARSALAHARALEAAGDGDRALARAREALALANRVDFPPVQVEAAARVGSALEETGQYEDAAKELEAAYWRASELGHDEIAAATTVQLVYVIGYRLGRHDDAQRWIRDAESAISRGSTPELEARLATNRAAILMNAGRTEQAVEHFERALGLRERAFGSDSLAAALSMSNLAVPLRKLGELDRVEALLGKSIEIHERELGLEHPALASRYQNLGMLREAQGDLDQADELYRRSLALVDADHPDAADFLNALAGVARQRQRWDEAEEYLRRGLGSLESTLGPDHPDVARQLTNLGHVLSGRGANEEALPLYRRAVQIVEARWRPDHPVLVMPLQGLGESLLALEKYDEAASTLARALEIAFAAKSPHVAELQFEYAVAKWEADETSDGRAEAIASAQNALASLELQDPSGVRESVQQWLADRR